MQYITQNIRFKIVTCLILLLLPVELFAKEKLVFNCPHLADNTKITFTPMTQGFDGWFYRIQEDLKEDFTPAPETISFFTRVANAFKIRGSSLIYIPIPPRGIVAQKYLDPSNEVQKNYSPTNAYLSYIKLIVALRSSGIMTSNFVQIGKDHKNIPFSFKRDHHWKSTGAKLAGKSIGNLITNHTKYSELSKSKYNTTQVGYQEMKGPYAIELQGLCNGIIPSEKYMMDTTERIVDNSAGALFGDNNESDPVVIVGTSFSANERFNFEGYISQYTGLETANYSIGGGGLMNSIISYTSSPNFHKTTPPFIVWEAQSAYSLNDDTEPAFRQIIPAIYGECSEDKAIATGKVEIKKGKGQTLLKVASNKEVSGNQYFIFLESSNTGFTNFTLQMDYSDGDGERFSIDRSIRYNNRGRFFVELLDEIDSSLVSVSIDSMPNVNTSLKIRVCRISDSITMTKN